ncbi:MAG: hypothetical protein ACTHLZ_19920 [Tepidisphaeraceae bacterium]
MPPTIKPAKYVSIGAACDEIRTYLKFFQSAANQLQQQPAFSLDGVPYYTADQVEWIGHCIHTGKVICQK